MALKTRTRFVCQHSSGLCWEVYIDEEGDLIIQNSLAEILVLSEDQQDFLMAISKVLEEANSDD